MINLNQIDYSNLMELLASPEWIDARATGKITTTDMQKILTEAKKRDKGQLTNASSQQLEVELKRLNSMQEAHEKAKAEMNTIAQLMGDTEDPYVKRKSAYIAKQAIAVEQQVNNLVSRLAALREARKRTSQIDPIYKPIDREAMPYHMAANDKAISFVVNEAVARYFTDNSGKFSPNGRGTPEEFFKHFVANSFIAKKDGYSPNLEADVIKAIKTAQARFNSDTGAFKHYSHFKYDSQIAQYNTLKTSLSTLYSSDKSHAVIFAPDKSTSTLAASAAKMMFLNTGLSKVEMLTPNGSKIFTRNDVYNHMPKKDEKAIAAEVQKSVLSYIGTGKERNYYTPLAKQQAMYTILQDTTQKIAKEQLVSLAVLANGQAGKSGLSNILSMPVGKLKAYGDYFGSTFKELSKFTRDDHKTLGESLDQIQLDRLTREVETKFDSSRKQYQAQAFNKAVKLGEALGIKPDAIVAQLVGKNSFDRANTLKGINSFLADSVQSTKAYNTTNGVNLSREVQWANSFPKRNSFAALLNSPDPIRNSTAIKALIKNINNEAFLSSRGLLDDTAANPVLNLQGNVQERFMKLFAKGIADTNIPFNTTFKGSVKIASKFLDTLSTNKVSHTRDIFEAVSDKLSMLEDNATLSRQSTKLAKGTKFAKYPSQLREPKFNDFLNALERHKDFQDEFAYMKQYDSSNFMASISSVEDELHLNSNGEVSARGQQAMASKQARDEATSTVMSRLKNQVQDDAKEEGKNKPIDELMSNLDLDALIDAELKAQGKSDFSIKKGQSIQQAIFGKAEGDTLSVYDELRLKASSGDLTFAEHEKLMSLAQALGVYTSNKAGTGANVAKIINNMNGLQKDYLAIQSSKDESRQAGVHLNTYLRWAASQGYMSQWDSIEGKKALESQYKQFVDLGLIRILDGEDGKPFVDFSRLTHSVNTKNSGIFIGTREAMDDTKATLAEFLDPSNDNGMVDDSRRIAILEDLAKTKYPSNYVYQAAKAIKLGKADKNTIIDNLFSNLRLGTDMVERGTLKGSGYAKLPELVSMSDRTAQKYNDMAKLAMLYKNPAAKVAVDSYVGQLPMHGKDGYKDPLAIKVHTLLKAIDSGEIDLKGLDKYGHNFGTKAKLVGSELLKRHLTTGNDGYNTAKSKAYHNAMEQFAADISSMQSNDTQAKLRVMAKYNKNTGADLTRDMFISGMKNVAVGGISTKELFKVGSKVPENTLTDLRLTAMALAESDFGDLGSLEALKSSKAGPLSYNQRRENYFSGLDSSMYKDSLSGRAFDAENNYLESIEKKALKDRGIGRLAKIRKLKPLKFAKGGKIPGKGTKDEVPALLTKGEVVLDVATSEKLGIHSQEDYDRFKQSIKLAKFATGGIVETEEERLRREAAEAIAKSSLDDLDSLMSINSVIGSIEATEPKVQNTKPATPKAKQQTIESIMAELEAQPTKQASDIQAKINELRGMSIKDIQQFIASGEYNNFTNAMGSNPLKPFKDLATSVNIRGMDTSTPISQYLSVDDATVLHPDEAKLLKGTTKGMFNQAGVSEAINARTESKYADMISNLAGNSIEELSALLKDPKEQARIFNALDKSKNKLLTPKAQEAYAKLQGSVIESVVGMSPTEFKETLSNPGVDLGSFSPAVQANLKSLANSDTDYARFKSILGDNGKALDGIMKPEQVTKLSKSINLINSNLEDFNRILGTNISKIEDQAGLDAAASAVIAANKTGWESTKRARTTEDLAKGRRFTKSLEDGIDSDTSTGFSTGVKLNDLGRQMGDSQAIRERSQMRWANFKELTVQNAAFAASYGVIGAPIAAVSAGAGFILELDDKLKNLQAITASTTPELEKLTKSVKNVSTETKFSAGEIADAATILGQAGFSAQDIQDSLKGVAELATATGSNIEDATQTLTSALTVWDAPMRDASKYANEFTASINKSKLDMNSLSLALQYAGNIAAEGDIPVEDLLTVTSLMKDAGIRQGSTVGTGQRLVYSDLLAPSAKFEESLASVGLTKEALKDKLDSGGVIEALKLMRDNGYGLTQASAGMELREKSAYLAIVNQLDKAQLFKSSIIGTDAATQANDIQMQSLLNLGKNMANSWGIALSDTIGTEFKGIGKAMAALTYKGSSSGYSNEDTSSDQIGSSIDYFARANNTDKQGGGLTAGLTAGALGALAYLGKDKIKGFISSTDKLGDLKGGALGLKEDFTKASKLGKLGRIGGYLALASSAIDILSSDNKLAETTKQLPILASMAGGAQLGATAGSLFGPGGTAVGGIVGGIAGPVAYGILGKEAYDAKVNNAFGIQKSYSDTAKFMNTNLEAGSSAMRDLYTTRLEVQKNNNNPLAVTEGMTTAEIGQVKSSLNKYSEELNKTYKAQLKELKNSKVLDSKGENFDFTAHAASNTDLAAYMQEFEDSYNSLQKKAIIRMNEAVIKSLESDNFKLDPKKDFSDQLSLVREDITNIFQKQAVIDPNALKAMASTHTKALEKFTAQALKQQVTAIEENFQDGKITESQKNQQVSDAKRAVARNKETYSYSVSNTLLTAGANLNKPQDILSYAQGLRSLENSNGISKEAIGESLLSLKNNYVKNTIDSNPELSKVLTTIGEVAAKFTKVNDTFRQFFRDAQGQVGDQSISLGRSAGQVSIAQAVELSKSWGSLNSIKDLAGKIGISNLASNFIGASPEDPTAKQFLKFMHKDAKFNIEQGLASGAGLAGKVEFRNRVAAFDLAEQSKGLPGTVQKLISTYGEDPALLKAFIDRRYKLEEIGFNSNIDPESFSRATGKELANSDVTAIIPALTGSFKKALEFNKEMAINQLSIQNAEFMDATFGGKNVSFEQSEYGYQSKQLEKAYDLNLKAMARQDDFNKSNIAESFQKNLQDLIQKFDFQREEMGIGYSNQIGAMNRQFEFSKQMAGLQAGWQAADAARNSGYAKEDAAKKQKYSKDDLTKANSDKLEDLYKNFDRSLAHLALSFSRGVESINRAMDFTKTMFERSLDKPVNITLNPESFLKVADALNNNQLALEAHKASLTANTTAIQQLVGIQQGKENLAKEAYKAAYKSVGGEVYNSDGSVNSKFTDEYNNYMKSNSEQLLDTVLEQALNRSLSASSFDATSALTNASYMANAVANPGAQATTEGLAQGSGYSAEEIVNALLGTASGEIRLSTSQGIVLEAQGDLGAALFDLQTSMLQYQNQISEAAISYSQAIQDAQTNLSYAIQDLAVSFDRSLESIQLNYTRELESINTNFQRNIESININLERSLTSLSLQHQFQLQEAAIRFRESLEALSRQEAFNKEQLQEGLTRALEDLAKNSEFRLSESAINNEQNKIAMDEGFARLVEKANLATEANVRAIEQQMTEAIRRAEFDASTLMDAVNRGLKKVSADQLPDMAYMIASFSKGMEKAAADTEWKLGGVINSINSSLEKLSKSEAAQEAYRKVGNSSITALLEGVTKGVEPTVKQFVDKFQEPIATTFKQGLDSLSKQMLDAADKNAQEASKAANSIAGPINRLTNSFSTVIGKSEDLIGLQVDLTKNIASLGSEASKAIAATIAQINAIKAGLGTAPNPVLRSTGGAIPGYGGGDIVPAMLEPGEYVIRKEVAKALGEQALNKLNFGTSSELVDSSFTKAIDLQPASSTSTSGGTNLAIGINVHPEMTIKSIQDNIEKIADGVQRVFQEYM